MKSAEGISDEAVRKQTGKGWKEWFAILDKAGAKKMDHKTIAMLLHEQMGVGPWWSQMVTVQYERARGLRELYQGPGGYKVSVSKTVNATIENLYAAFADAGKRARWLKAPKLEVRKATPARSMRITWNDGTHVEANFYAKGARKSQVSVQHSKLADADDAQRRRTFWAISLEKVKHDLEQPGGASARCNRPGRGSVRRFISSED